jgi:PAS domain S-box-containing protein
MEARSGPRALLALVAGRTLDGIDAEALLLDQLGAAVVATDVDGRVTHWNGAAERLFGRAAAEATGQPAGELLDRDGASAAAVFSLLASGASWDGELTAWRPDGTPIVCLVAGAALLDPDGQPVGGLAVALDLTHRKHAEQRLALQYAVASILSETETLAAAAPRLLAAIGEALGWEIGTLFALDEPTQTLRAVDVWSHPLLDAERFTAATRAAVFGYGDALPGRIWAAGEPVWIPNVDDDPSFSRAEVSRQLGLHAAFSFPVVVRGHIVGVVEFLSPQIRPPDETLLRMASGVGSQIGQYIERQNAERRLRASDARKTAMLEGALDCVVSMDAAGRVVEWNPAAEVTFGWTREEATGRQLAELIIPPRLRRAHYDSLTHHLQTGEMRMLGRRVELVGVRRDGSEFPVELTITRVDLPDGPLFTGFLRDIEARKRAEDELRRSRDQLGIILRGVAEAITVQQPDGELLFANDAAARTLGFATAEELVATPAAEVVSRFEIFDESGHRFPLEALPGRVALGGGHPPEAVVRFRVVATGEERWSVVNATPVFDQQGGVQFAINIFHDITDRKRADEHQRFLAETASTLGASLNYRVTLSRLARLLVPRIADWCSIDVVEEDGAVVTVETTHVNPAQATLARELRDRYPARPEESVVHTVLETGEPVLISDVSDEMLSVGARDGEHLALLRRLALRSVIVLPLIARTRVLGAMVIATAESGRRYGEEDVTRALEIAHRAAVAIDNARLYGERTRIARTLQRSLLPRRVPDIPGVEVAPRYRPVGEAVEVGGDFYDVFAAGDGWIFLVGDVCGKGVEAAALTGLARHTLRAVAMSQESPAEVLRQVNAVVAPQIATDRFLTVACARLVLGDGTARLTVSAGGHPLPLVVRRDGTVHRVGQPGTLIGPIPEAQVSDETVELEPGDAVVLYTDGVVEARTADGLFGERGLIAALERSAGLPAARIAEQLEEAVLRFQPAPRDDIALLVLRVMPQQRSSAPDRP